MYCNKPLTTDKKCGYKERRHGCIVWNAPDRVHVDLMASVML